ncbi:RNA-binding protein 38-like [Trifolium pratense]|uniref:RNA-binding protein 38-like n=1 Tax=Trifolium pratense TaxID=57577 RepID=A0A2K3NM07_TRIPR|nr:probable RNA-binding protein ARP1 [Trifolium pratense]PNY04063.1 RNA-binding protein 38-like [Trifolium pratense]
MSSSSSSNNGGYYSSSHSQFGDTTLTKVFVGGLAWETPKDTLREHFQKYGDILEAVIISDKLTGRSKGYGFVTFKEPEAANKACQEPTLIINGRRANCNIASLGARRPRTKSSSSPTATTPPSSPPSSQVQWYYPVATPTMPTPFHHQHAHTLPFYIGTDPHMMNYNYNYGFHYNQKLLSYGSGGSYVYPRVGAMPVMYHPLYRTEAMGVPAPQIYHHYAPSITPTPTTCPVGTGEMLQKSSGLRRA